MVKYDYFGLKKSHKVVLTKKEWVRSRIQQGCSRRGAELGWELAGSTGKLLVINGESVISVEHIRKRDAEREDPMQLHVTRPEVISIADN